MMCYTPYELKTGERVPCGRCPNCRKRRSNMWAFRLQKHEQSVQQSLFLTLTYEDAPMTSSLYMTLVKKHCQDYMKRLRKATPGIKYTYYMCGEYGGRTWRPHYHQILMCTPMIDPVEVERAWQHGFVKYGTVTGASIGYVLKYMQKPGKIPLHRNDDRVPEFSLFSKGIGANYLTDAAIKWHKADLSRHYVVAPGGFKLPIPRYYRSKIYDEDEFKAGAQQRAQEQFEQQYQQWLIGHGMTDGVDAMQVYRSEMVVRWNQEFRSAQSVRDKL